jgi:hypothetical protein
MKDYGKWLAEVSKLFMGKYGLHIDMIPDQPWYGWWDSEMTPKEAVDEAINAGRRGEWW